MSFKNKRDNLVYFIKKLFRNCLSDHQKYLKIRGDIYIYIL